MSRRFVRDTPPRPAAQPGDRVVYECGFCGRKYKAYKTEKPDTIKCCGNLQCIREFDTLRQKNSTEGLTRTKTWEERTSQHKPGEHVAGFAAPLTGGKFTRNGGVQLIINVPPDFKQEVFDVMDYTGITLWVDMRVLTEQEAEEY